MSDTGQSKRKVRTASMQNVLKQGESGTPLQVDFSPLFPFFEKIAAGMGNRSPEDGPSPTVILPPEYDALQQLYFSCHHRQEDRNWYSVRTIAKKAKTTHTTLYRSKLFMFFYRLVVESLPPEERVRLPKGILRFDDKGKVDGLDAVDD
jgi:hypothetical protein